jgi:hypothetical protein
MGAKHGDLADAKRIKEFVMNSPQYQTSTSCGWAVYHLGMVPIDGCVFGLGVYPAWYAPARPECSARTPLEEAFAATAAATTNVRE